DTVRSTGRDSDAESGRVPTRLTRPRGASIMRLRLEAPMHARSYAGFLGLAGALAIGLTLASVAAAQLRVHVVDKPKESAKPRLKQAIKFDMVGIEGTVEEKFALVKSLGFDGVEIDSPSKLDRDAVVAASAKTGVIVHGVIDAQHWEKRFSDPDANVRAT